MFFYIQGSPFPDPASADHDGLLAVGGDLSVDTLLKAYCSGIFPWYNENDPILWWSPDPRMVLFPDKFKVSKSFRKILRDPGFQVTFNQNFEQVIEACASISRSGQRGTWITQEIKQAYLELYRQGFAVSVECWYQGNLAGGLYGIDLVDKKVFCGESMFHTVSNASKVALYFLSEKLKKENYQLIDCQIHSDHLASLGAENISRQAFLRYLQGS
jgi:leucyl/phenylalanyl-tRNA--protein transferase